MSDDPMRLGDLEAWIDSGKYLRGTYDSGTEQFLYSINLSRAEALHTGIDLYPIIYAGWISKSNGENRKPASFILFTDKECADKYCSVNMDDPSFLPSYLPSSIHVKWSNEVYVCVMPVQGFLNLTEAERMTSTCPVFGNPTTWVMQRVKELVKVFLAMIKHGTSNSLWNCAGCYLVCDGKIKVIVNEFKMDHTAADWEIRIAHNLIELSYGLYNYFLDREVDWPLRDSFLDFFDASNKIDNDLKRRIKRILTHTFLMEDPREILQLAHKAFQSFDVLPPQTPRYKYSKLYYGITHGSFINSLDSGRFTDDPGSNPWLFYVPLIPEIQSVYFNHNYDHHDGLSFAKFVRNIVNLDGVPPYATHREIEMIFPGLFHRLHEFT